MTELAARRALTPGSSPAERPRGALASFLPTCGAAQPWPAICRLKCEPCRGGTACGFTLLELLVAVAIMALVSLLAWRGLSSLLATRERLIPENEDVRALLTGFGQMQLDLTQAASPLLLPGAGPPVRMRVVDGSPTLLILRIAPPLADGASAVQQVIYSIQDGNLLRQATQPTRSLPVDFSATPAGLRLLPRVASMQVRFWRPNQGWVIPAEADPTAPPGVEVELIRADGSRFRRVMLVS